MMAFFVSGFALTTSLMLSWPGLIVLFFAGVLFEHNENHGFAVFIALLIAAASYLFFGIPVLTIAIGALVYLAIGFIWSFWRYKRHAEKVVAENINVGSVRRETAIKKLHPKEMLGTITAWIVTWPFSVIENIVGDIINTIQSAIQTVFRKIYYRIYNSAIEELERSHNGS